MSIFIRLAAFLHNTMKRIKQIEDKLTEKKKLNY